MGGTHLLLDAGPGTFAVLQTLVDPGEVDAVVVSHHHADHWTDLYAMDTQARFGGRRSPLPVYAPAEVARRADPERTPMPRVARGDRRVRAGIGEVSCAFHRTDHAEETLAVRVDGGGRALGYSADTGPEWSPDVLGHRTRPAAVRGHLHGRARGDRRAPERAPGRCGGTGRRCAATRHHPPVAHGHARGRWPEEAEAAFGGPVEQAAIGKEFTL